jgi:16S rRNA (cytidine1402-2'-O)-methyltransferase
VVATPIGNLADLSPRAVSTLQRASLILCEDTRNSATLLRHHGINRPLKALHEHNERAQLQALIERLRAGEELALISDAGTPLVSDPGYALVRAARLAQLPVRAVPGPCALIAALSIAGLPSDRFSFEGFLPAAAKARQERLAALAQDSRTLVFYEAPHRIVASLADCVEALGADREAAIARELSKRFESLYRATLGELQAMAATDTDLQRGEIVLLIAGQSQREAQLGDDEARRIHRLLAAELPPTQAAKLAAKITGRSRKDFYA